ncbi:RNA polymerase sigma-70 factor, ECF subfamily [Parasphingorhabdus marina DSM 22363]|uniref:RNA polymerase sigma-70 factor, ECF subfamily n=1 Tax=Parasphingorhabdus marina DSM 22363 TaxID=1123272 RepID=A0A1N6CNC6_9SPHN|nr:sigma-70 family RNA polymerase sigma factor [Parasphingorhabdus marina]SIN60002.1 RNA polymerase sigma-70 factor, ECF subfamily [Parasphingorhabdus marina DSM 22363]
MRYSDTERIFDELLLTRIQAGDRRAGERLAARWQPRLMRTAYRLLRDEDQARIAVQEAWTGICKGWRGLRGPNRFPAWAYTILHRRCADRVRAAQRQRKMFSEADASVEEAIGPRAEDKVTIDQAFDRLSPDHRIAAILYFSEGLTAREIAAVTAVPLGTAKTRIFHARKQLQAELDDNPVPEGVMT